MTLSDQQFLFLRDVVKLLQNIFSCGYKVTGGELKRTMYQQKEYVRIGKSWTMNSDHIKQMAIDLNIFIDGELTYDKEKLKHIGDFWESLSPQNYWGGKWEGKKCDVPHFGKRRI